jgi:hypothetical protein
MSDMQSLLARRCRLFIALAIDVVHPSGGPPRAVDGWVSTGGALVAEDRAEQRASGAAVVKQALISGLAPDAPDHRNSGFRATIKRLALPADARILEVGGLSGDHTTTHLLDVFDSQIDVIEIDTERASSLQLKYDSDPSTKSRVRLHNLDARDFSSRIKYDLLVLDMPTGMINVGYTEILPHLATILATGAKIIIYTIYDHAAAYEVDNPPRDGEQQKAFMLSFFGAAELTLERVGVRMQPEGYAALALVDRWMLKGQRRGHGWVCLEKLPSSLGPPSRVDVDGGVSTPRRDAPSWARP